MVTEAKVQTVLAFLYEMPPCQQCGTRFRFGDVDCPHCGQDLDGHLYAWAEELLRRLEE